MPKELEESGTSLNDSQIQEIFRDLNESLNISVDINSYDLSGMQFWSQLESDLVKSLEIDSVYEVEQGRKKLALILEKSLAERGILLKQLQFGDLLDRIVDHYFGLGVLDSLLRDEGMHEIMINGFQEIYFEKKGRLQRAAVSYWSDIHLRHVIDRICIQNNVDLPSDKKTITRFTLPDNLSITILFPPVTPNSPAITIQRFTKNPITMEQLVQFGAISAEMLQFLKGAIEAGLNILVCGHLGSGANTLVNILSSFIPGDERVISIEHENDFSLKVNHLVRLIASDDPTSENSYKKVLALAGKLRGDRLVLSSFSFPDAYDVLNSINDRFLGSLVRVSSKSPADAIHRLETFIQLDKPSIPITKIRSLISSSVDLIAYQERLRDGTRAVTNVVEVLDETDNNDQVALREIYDIEQMGVKDGRIIRKFRSHGPPSEKLIDKINAVGIELPSRLFASGVNAEKKGSLSEIEKRVIKFSKGKYAFVSYSKDDRDHVRALVKKIENNGFDIWLDVFNIKPGEEWTKILEHAIKNAGVFVVILTPSAAKSQFVRNEIVMAQDEKLPIIPVKMEECDVPIQIRALQYILIDKRDFATAVNLISEVLSKHISNKQLFGNI